MRWWENHAHSEVWVRWLHGSPLSFDSQQDITRQIMIWRYVPPHYYSARTRPTRRHLFNSLHCIIWMANEGLSHQSHPVPFFFPDMLFLITWHWITFLKTLWTHLNLTWMKLLCGEGRKGNGYILAGQDTPHRFTGRKPTPNLGFHSITSSYCTLSTYYVPGASKKEK